MKEKLIDLLSSSPHEVSTALLAMLPISELRGAIPYAITVADMPWQKAYAIAVVANFVPVIPILLLVGPVSQFLRRVPVFDRFISWLFERTRRRGKLIERFEVLGLILFVAIPLPITGAWTGALAAFLFNVKKRSSIPAIFAGILIAGIIVTLASLGMITVWGIAHG